MEDPLQERKVDKTIFHVSVSEGNHYDNCGCGGISICRCECLSQLLSEFTYRQLAQNLSEICLSLIDCSTAKWHLCSAPSSQILSFLRLRSKKVRCFCHSKLTFFSFHIKSERVSVVKRFNKVIP